MVGADESCELLTFAPRLASLASRDESVFVRQRVEHLHRATMAVESATSH